MELDTYLNREYSNDLSYYVVIQNHYPRRLKTYYY